MENIEAASELGANMRPFMGSASLTGSSSSYNYPSTAASIASSDLEYQHDLSNSYSTFPISRPLSRTSNTSCLSVTLFKDGIEGKRVHRTGIPNYPYNLIAGMIDTRYLKSPVLHPTTISAKGESTDDQEDDANEKMNLSSGPPVSLNEKMKLLKTGQVNNNFTDPNGPSVGPVIFNNSDEESTSHTSDDVSMTEYARFQKNAALEFDD